MFQDKLTEKNVKAANRRFYDIVADCYEKIDGRRSPSLEVWLRKNLTHIREQSSGGDLLDLGTGSGLVTRCAEGLFPRRVGIDLSPQILGANRKAFDLGAAGDIDTLPFRDNSFDVVTCFAVLHHLFSFEGLVSEVARVLRPGGIFYSDHDMDAAFSERFSLPLKFYRGLCSSEFKYLKASKSITKEMYKLAEWHRNGVELSLLLSLLINARLFVKTEFHWFGLNRITDKFFGEKCFSRGFAPLFSIIAFSGK